VHAALDMPTSRYVARAVGHSRRSIAAMHITRAVVAGLVVTAVGCKGGRAGGGGTKPKHDGVVTDAGTTRIP
jgi:hypothetical protein